MSETKHSPSPWGRNIKPVSHYPTIYSGRNRHVAVLSSLPDEEMEANANLIAAAPELLVACEAFVAWVDHNVTTDDDGDLDNEMAQAAEDLARVAIVKAKGESTT